VTDVAGVARWPCDGAAVEDEPAADSRRDDHAHEVVAAAASANPVLGEHDADAVHAKGHGQPGNERRHELTQRVVAPGGDVERRHGTERGVDRSGRSDACADEGSPLRERGERSENGAGHGCGEGVRVRRVAGGLAVAASLDDASSVVDESGLDLRSSEIDGERDNA
jgi:hypothetical protein